MSGGSGREPVVLQAELMIVEARVRLQRELGREPTTAELVRETGLSEELIGLCRDETGTGAVPTWLLDRWVDFIDGDLHLDDPPAVVVVRALLGVALDVSDDYMELIRMLARANAGPEGEMARLTLLWTTWTTTLAEALRRRGVPPTGAETAAKRAMIVLWDAVTRWGADGHRGHYGPFLRDALLAQIPEAILVVDELTGALPEWNRPPTEFPDRPEHPPATRHPGRSGAPGPQRSFRVVLVDDNDVIRHLWQEFLERAPGFEVVGCAVKGDEGLEVCHAEHPDAVVTDWEMPGLDGVELARRLRSEHPDVVIVLCSTRDRRDVPPHLAALGVAYLNKVRSSELPELLSRLLTARQR